MLAAGLIHGDLSEFNILIDEHRAPVIIDPAPGGQCRRQQFGGDCCWSGDVDRLRRCFGPLCPGASGQPTTARRCGPSMPLADCSLTRRLTGRYVPEKSDVNLTELMGIIDAAREEELERREAIAC